MSYSAKAGLGFAVVCILYVLFNELTVGRRRRSLKKVKGTLPAPWYTGFWDHVLGSDLFRLNMQEIKEHRFLEGAANRFVHDKINTMKLVSLGRQFHLTVEPENLKVCPSCMPAYTKVSGLTQTTNIHDRSSRLQSSRNGDLGPDANGDSALS